MKTYKHLFEYVLTDVCMDTALRKAIKRKGNRKDIQEVLENKEQVKANIRCMIRNHELPIYEHIAYKKVDGISQKERIIVRSFFTVDKPEQWIHHMIILALDKVLSKGRYFLSCGSVQRKGIHFGKTHTEAYIQRSSSKTKYCAKLDISKFYQNIDVDILKSKFSRIIKDKDMLYLIFWILDNNLAILPDGTKLSSGIIIGSYPSQHFANFMLQDFDHWVKEVLRVPFYARYMDDMVLFHSNKRQLHKIVEIIRKELHLSHLVIKGNWQVFRFHYVNKNGKETGRCLDFMGFRFFKTRTEIRRAILYRASRAVRVASKMKVLNAYMACRILSYKGFFDVTDTYFAYRKHILAKINIEHCKKVVSLENKRRQLNECNLQTIKQQYAA